MDYLSNIDISEIVKIILELGQGFYLPNKIIDTEKMTIEFVKFLKNKTLINYTTTYKTPLEMIIYKF